MNLGTEKKSTESLLLYLLRVLSLFFFVNKSEMYYAVNDRSRCVHADSVCKRARVKNARLIQFDPLKMHKCKFCFVIENECYVCLEVKSNQASAKCNAHYMCGDCIDRNVEVLCQTKGWNCQVVCPCGSEFDKRILSKKSKQRIEKYSSEAKNETQSYRKFHYDIITEDILTLKCPSCRNAFIDFDGCLALYCNCGAYFCGKCMCKFDSSKDAHSHVLVCHGDYYMPYAEWEMHIFKLKFFKAMKYILITIHETTSVMYGISLFCMMLPHILKVRLTFIYILYVCIAFIVFNFPLTSIIWMYGIPLALSEAYDMLNCYSKKCM